MAFGFAGEPIRKYVYGVREFLRERDQHGKRQRFEGHDLALDQLQKAHRFQNALVALERERRAAIEAVLHEADEELRQLNQTQQTEWAAVRELRDQLAATNSMTRQRQKEGEEAESVREQKAVAKAASGEYYARRKQVFAQAEVKATIKLVEADFASRQKATRAAAIAQGLYWATASHVIGRIPTDFRDHPNFHRWEGKGLLVVQVQRKGDAKSPQVPVLLKNGQPRIHPRSGKPTMRREAAKPFGPQQAESGSTLLHICRDPDNPKYAEVHLRIASDENSNPLWVVLPTVLHRPMPTDAEIKFVYLSRRKRGTQWKWEVQFDLAKKWETPKAASGMVAVALGWRKIEGDLRVGYWVGDDGQEGEIVIDKERFERWGYCDGIQGTRDTLLNHHLLRLRTWLGERTLSPEWSERTQHCGQWKSPAQFASLMLWWRDNRVDGDEAIYRELEGVLIPAKTSDGKDTYSGGRKQDKHLYDWQSHMKQNCLDWRKNYYRNLAAEWAGRYRTVVVADIDWAKLLKNPQIEDEDEAVNKTNTRVAAVASLKDALAARLDAMELDPAGITIDCYRCGNRMDDPGAGRWVRCECCGGGVVDRAQNAAKNLLNRALQLKPEEVTARVAAYKKKK